MCNLNSRRVIIIIICSNNLLNKVHYPDLIMLHWIKPRIWWKQLMTLRNNQTGSPVHLQWSTSMKGRVSVAFCCRRWLYHPVLPFLTSSLVLGDTLTGSQCWFLTLAGSWYKILKRVDTVRHWQDVPLWRHDDIITFHSLLDILLQLLFLFHAKSSVRRQKGLFIYLNSNQLDPFASELIKWLLSLFHSFAPNI